MRILFISATRIGDAVLSSGLLAHLIARCPEARLTVAAGPLAAPLFEAVPGLERLIVVHKRRWSLHWLSLYAALVGQRWDIVVDLRGSALAWFLAAGERKVMAKGDPREHRVRQVARLFRLDPPPSPTLWTAPDYDEAAARLIPPGGPVLAIGPAASWRGKEWPADRFAELAARLTAPDGILPRARIAVLAAAEERPQVQPVLDAIPPARRIDLVGGLELPVVAAVLRRCALFVGNDSGLMHIAAACGIPTLGLFGPSPVAQYAPWGPRCAVASSPVAVPARHRRTDYTLMDGLSVDTVEAAAQELWRSLATAVA